MPFKRTPGGGYVSPSGKHWTAKQVKLYYATDGFAKKPRKTAARRRAPFLSKRP